MLYKDLILYYKDDIIEKIQEFISIKSVENDKDGEFPFGKPVAEALNYVLNLANELGLDTVNFDNYAGHIEMGSGNEIFGIAGHVDVVPAISEGWRFEPFKGEIYDGAIYGRGALDDKGPIIAALYAMKIVKDLGYKFSRRVRLILGTNEETRWEGIKYYLEKEKQPDFAVVPDADFPLIHGEKGILLLKFTKKLNKTNNDLFIEGGEVVNSVPKLCEAKIKLKQDILENIENNLKPRSFNFENTGEYLIIKANGKAAHGSTPNSGENAISKLMFYLSNNNFSNEELKDFIKFYNRNIGLDYNGTNLGLDFEDEQSGKLTLNVGKLLIDQNKIEMEIDIRYPFCTKYEEVMGILKKYFNKNGFEIEVMSRKKEIYIPEHDELIQRLMKIYMETTGDIDSKPLVIGGGTYARAFDNALAFGPLFPGVKDTCHQKDECIRIDNLMRFTEIYIRTIIEFACSI